MKKSMVRSYLSKFAAAAMVAALMAGCGSGGGNTTAAVTTAAGSGAETTAEQTGSAASEEKFTVGFSVLDMGAEFLVAMVQGAQDTAEELGMEFILADCKLDAVKQTDQVNNFVAQGVDAIVIEPWDADAIVAAIKEANEANIPVFTIDTSASGGEVMCYTASDNYKMGEMAAEYILEQLHERYGEYKGKVVNLMASLTSTSGTLRSQGFKDAVAKYPDVEIVAEQNTDLVVENALNVTMDILQANDQIDAIWCSGDNNALGAIQAIEQLGRFKEASSEDHIIVASADGCSEILKAIRNKSVDACISQNPITMGEMTIQMAYDYLKDGKTPESEIAYCELYTITSENIDSEATAQYGLWSEKIK